jgi:hypothetical protein
MTLNSRVSLVLRKAVFAGLLSVALATTAHAAASPEDPAADEALLRRHAPILRYDSRERLRATAVEAVTDRRLTANGRASDAVALHQRPHAPDVVYGRRVAGRGGRVWLQYWMLYADNPQDRGIVRTGRHEGDWEVVQVELERGRPVAAVLAQHSWSERCGRDVVERRAGRPVVYVANGSHASYARAGVHGRPWPDPDDESDGRGRIVRPRVVAVSGTSPAWVRWPGSWGRSRAGIVPGEHSSPRGPAFQREGPWRDPGAYAAGARPCGSGAPPLPAALVLAVAAAVAIAVAAATSLITANLLRRRPT